MKKHLTHFNSRAEFNAAFKSGTSSGFELEGPHVSYIGETKIRYMKKNDPIFERPRDRKIFEENKIKYFTMTALEDGIQVGCTLFPEVSAIEKMSYSLDKGETWTEFTRSNESVEIVVPTLNTGDTVSWKGEFNSSGAQNSGNKYFVFRFNDENSGYLELSGNLGSLLYGNDFSDYVSTRFEYTNLLLGNIKGYIRSIKYLVLDARRFNLSRLFSGCQNLLYGPVELPATTLTQRCYDSMFNGCTSLTFAPDLPATTLAVSCYYQMFYSCTSLTEAPELPATALANNCYQYMFNGCRSLTEAPELPATTLADYCYSGMFGSCTALIGAPELPATTLADRCYQYMFQGCTSLKSAPELPATTLANFCYSSMFNGCTSLTSAPELSASTLANSCYSAMFRNCTSLTEAPELPATTLADYCYNDMFNGCAALTTAPTLPATTLANSCYHSMFSGCTSLTSAPKLSAATLKFGCYRQMFEGCTSLTEAPELSAAVLAYHCCYQMFEGCISLTEAPELHATTLTNYCYYRMFYGCKNLNNITMLATSKSASAYDCLREWVYGVASTGTFTKAATMTTLPQGTSGIPSGWTVETASS